MVDTEEVREATCRVDSGDEQIGSGFWISDDKLVTAAHVADHLTGNDGSVQTNTGSVNVHVCYTDNEDGNNTTGDLAILEATQDTPDHGTLSVEQNIPSIGTEVTWSGYARLFGERRIDRQRFGWGRVASEEYGRDDAKFFEVDGLFNPAHSGGPVLSTDTEHVVGVVSASAGRFDRLEDAWQERVDVIEKAEEIYNISQTGGKAGFYSTLETPDYSEGQEVQKVFDRIGLDYEVSYNSTTTNIRMKPSELPVRYGSILQEMANLLMDTARDTFQMGVGIATGGAPLREIVQNHTEE